MSALSKLDRIKEMQLIRQDLGTLLGRLAKTGVDFEKTARPLIDFRDVLDAEETKLAQEIQDDAGRCG